ncbi:GDSL-type esterase/lipase family protein [Sphingomonas sp. 1P06PA]|uniref:GDSL-type esterase/lipase family protein n=1 Tax=Sphingomonas sp. 1P06PA TaxID=554121 RepID=UPI0039A76401
MTRALLLIAAALSAMPIAAAAAPCADTLCDADELRPYFEKLMAARAKRSGRPVHILQIGDSHTAGDAITGGWRDLLQARFGSGGRGVLAGGRPYQGYLTRGVTVTMSSGWQVKSIYGANSAEPRPPIGLAGFSLTARTSGAKIALTAEPNQMFDRFVLCAVADRDAGTLVVRLAGAEARMQLNSVSPRPECRTFDTFGLASAVEVEAEGAPVTITSWATFRDAGGVVLSNVGVVGAQLMHFARTSDSVIGEELKSYRPDLIVMAFGTNEGFTPRFSPSSYEITLRTQIGRLRRLAGNVPILLLGAPDASSRQPALRANADGAPAICPGTGSDWSPSAPATPAPVRSDPLAATIDALRDQAATEGLASDPAIATAAIVPAPRPAPVAATRPSLFAPPALKATRDIQRKVAAQLGVAFWDWEARMGGPCSAVKWVRGTPPLMRGDYVHFNSAGGREIGRLLQGDLDRAASAALGGR